jgi:hypothetical protein
MPSRHVRFVVEFHGRNARPAKFNPLPKSSTSTARSLGGQHSRFPTQPARFTLALQVTCEITSGNSANWGPSGWPLLTLAMPSGRDRHQTLFLIPRLRCSIRVPSAAGRQNNDSVWLFLAWRTSDKVRPPSAALPERDRRHIRPFCFTNSNCI